MNKIILYGFFLLISYNIRPQSNEMHNISIKKDYKITVDKFLNDKGICQRAKDLYNNKVKPSDDEDDLSLIDSLNSKGAAKGFYFLVITKTMKYADGAYAEPLGIVAKSFAESNTIEFLSYFIENKDLLTNEDFKNWARTVYGEIQIDSEGSEQKAVSDLKTKMTNNCKNLSEEYKTRIDKFIGLMK